MSFIILNFSNALLVHKKIHSSEAHYKCRIPMCSRRFRSANGRKQHEMTHSGIIFGCDQCDKQYRSSGLLKAHVRKCHPKTEEESGA